jgi:uncharacterized protein (DUF433 family)
MALDLCVKSSSWQVNAGCFFMNLFNCQVSQSEFGSFLKMHLRRKEPDPIRFGKLVTAGTAMHTATIAVRFKPRESVDDLVEEYGRTKPEIEEAIRGERAGANRRPRSLYCSARRIYAVASRF